MSRPALVLAAVCSLLAAPAARAALPAPDPDNGGITLPPGFRALVFADNLVVDRRVAASTQNQALAAILFLYKDGLDRNPGWAESVARAKRPQWLPVLLTRQEIHNLSAALDDVSWIRCRSMP